jgi:protein TonB
MLVPSLALHLAVFLPLVTMAPEAATPVAEATAATVDIVVDASTTEAMEPPAEALPTAPPPPPMPDAPPPPPPMPEPPPPEPTEVAALEPPPPAPPPPAEPPPPAPPPQAEAPPPPPVVVPRPPSQSATPRAARTATAGPVTAAPAATPRPPAEEPDTSLRIEGATLSPDWIRQLQIWWDRHAVYPKEALDKGISGTVKVHLQIHQNGEVWTSTVVGSSGSEVLDKAGYEAFHWAMLRPFPAGTPAPQADAYITMHFVLTHRAAGAPAPPKRPFTITDGPVEGTVADIMLRKTCVGMFIPLWTEMLPDYPVQAVFYRKPDGTKWVEFTRAGRPTDLFRVTEVGTSAQWTDNPYKVGKHDWSTHFTVWPEDDNRIVGTTVDPWGRISLTCQ